MLFRQLFEKKSSTYTYLLADLETRAALLIDPVLETFERDAKLLRDLELRPQFTVETHIHADHVTSAQRFRSEFGTRSIGPTRGGASCADRHVDHGDVIEMGALRLHVRSTPGHTDACTCYYLERQSPFPDMIFTGDALLIRGCGRTDFQSGCAATLYQSVHEQIFSLPDDTEVYPGHDYRGFLKSTVGEEKRVNPRLGGGKSQEEFVQIMKELNLALPKQILRALPANLACGKEQPSPFIAQAGDSVAQVDVAWVRAKASMVKLVDIRSADEVQGELAMIPGAVHIPLDRLEDEMDEWDKDLPVVTVCRSGQRSLGAAATLKNMGFSRVASMTGGMQAFAEAASSPA